MLGPLFLRFGAPSGPMGVLSVGAARKKQEDERRRQVAEMLHAEWQVAKEHHALACQWRYGWRPWKSAVARSQHTIAAARSMRCRSLTCLDYAAV